MKERKEKDVRVSGSAKDRIELLKWQEKTFTVTRTNRTTTIKVKNLDKLYSGKPTNDEIYIYAKSHIPKTFFPVMKKLKEMVKANISRMVDHNGTQTMFLNTIPYSVSPFDVEYYNFADSLRNIYPEAGRIVELTDIIELDITKAYYHAALVLGFITLEFYEECISLPKAMRLRLIGSIATSKTIQYYIDGILEEDMTEINEDEDLRDAWFKLCSYIDESMKTLKSLLGKNFLFYWVDGVYFKNFSELEMDNGDLFDYRAQGFATCLDYLIHRLRELYHLECEITKVNRIEIRNETIDNGISFDPKIEIRLEKVKNGELIKKLFYPPKDSIRYYELTDENEFK